MSSHVWPTTPAPVAVSTPGSAGSSLGRGTGRRGTAHRLAVYWATNIAQRVRRVPTWCIHTRCALLSSAEEAVILDTFSVIVPMNLVEQCPARSGRSSARFWIFRIKWQIVMVELSVGLGGRCVVAQGTRRNPSPGVISTVNLGVASTASAYSVRMAMSSIPMIFFCNIRNVKE